MLLAQGTLLEGKYRVERLLGAGGMGSVWVAEHTLLQRPVAIKILDTTSTTKDPSAVQRFLREAQTAARIRNDHIVDVLDVGRFGDAEGTPFLVMELLEGETLSSRIRRSQRLSQWEAADLVDQLLAGLAAAHDAGVIHRDIKPDNCFLVSKNGRDHLKLLDFGISKVAGDPREMRMTKTGVVMGTPYYMAPEQARGGKQIDHRCDLYAAGAILYECVTGRVPFEAENVNELLFKIVLEQPATPRSLAPELDAAFEEVIARAMSREADARYATAQAFRDALAPFLVTRSRPTGTLVSDRPPSLPPSNPIVSSDRAVFRTPGTSPVSGVGDTKPIESDPMPPTLPAGSATPSGIPALSSSGPVQPTTPPPPARNTPLYAAAAIAILAITGGGIFLATRRAPAVDVPATAHASDTRVEIGEAPQPTTKEPSPPKVAPEPTATEPTPAPTASSSAPHLAPHVPPHASQATTIKRLPPIAPVAPPSTTVITPPTGILPPGTIAPPRPIDTTL